MCSSLPYGWVWRLLRGRLPGRVGLWRLRSWWRRSGRERADDSVANRLTGRGQDRVANQIRRSGRAQPGSPGADADADAEKERGSDNQPDLRGKATVQRADHALRLFSHALVGALLRGVRHFRTQRGAVSLR